MHAPALAHTTHAARMRRPHLRPCRSAVLARIEGFVSDSLAAVAAGGLPELELASRAADNAHMVRDGAEDGGAGADDDSQMGSGDDDGGGDDYDASQEKGRRGRGGRRSQPGARVRLGAQVQIKSITRSQGKQAHTVARGGLAVWQRLDGCGPFVDKWWPHC
jgi:hypothetical protein